MNIYHNLNKVIQYIEENLENQIQYDKIARILGTNEYTAQKIFSIICDVTLSDYIRRRRLSNAAQDLYMTNAKIIDIAVKYQYTSATAFSRAFKKFYGLQPSEVKTQRNKLKIYTKLIFDENIKLNKNIQYSIINQEELKLYGQYIDVNINNIRKKAPHFIEEIINKYNEHPDYGMTIYENEQRINPKQYWILYKNQIEKGKQYIIPKSQWIQFIINNQNTKDIQNAIDVFYKDFLINCKYKLKDLPELEYYHDGITEFLISIEN